jgi:CBS domain-containing protein
MGENKISDLPDSARMRDYVRALLEDVHALERILESDLIESGVRRIGAEQEMFLADKDLFPRNSALPMLERLKGLPFTTELAQFNLEANLSPLVFEGNCLSSMESELDGLLEKAREAGAVDGTRIVLCGILPTLNRSHLSLASMTPIPRFHQLNKVMVEQRGGHFKTYIKGIDEFQLSHDNVMLEACNTSFQVHFQVGAKEFASLYNLAQLITAPVLAAAVNSPVLLQHRLWHETRVALFQQSVDTRSETKAARGMRPRVDFGDRWLRSSIMEVLREDVARFRSLIAIPAEESPLEMLERGEIPQLKALRLHNGTIYRWNRPCYGVADGRAHLRIEMRAMPAGPTVLDEMANAAFFFGLMASLSDEYGDVSKVMDFDDAKANFVTAARYGLHARMRWLRGKPYGVEELILQHLLPLSRAGLQSRKIDAGDIDRYMTVIEERVRSGRTGAQWALDSLGAMKSKTRPSEAFRALTAAMVHNQEVGLPVARWELPRLESGADDPDNYRTVDQVMTTDVFTLHPDDLVDLAASVMDWEHIRYVPVEDREGHLLGLVAHRALLRILARGVREGKQASVAISDIMTKDLVTVSPQTSTLEAVELMREHGVGCLPVVNADNRLVGIVTEHDFVEISAKLLDRWLRRE